MVMKKSAAKPASKKPAAHPTHSSARESPKPAPAPAASMAPAVPLSAPSAPLVPEAPSRPSPPPIPAGRSALNLQQKTALIGGALILALVLGSLLLGPMLQSYFDPARAATLNAQAFNQALVANNQSGILVDVRGGLSAEMRQKIMQCEVDLVSGEFYMRTGKDLQVYFCDDAGCLSSRHRYDLETVSAATSNATIPFSDALYGLRGRTYFHLLYANQSTAPIYTPNYVQVFISPDSNESCAINVRTSS